MHRCSAILVSVLFLMVGLPSVGFATEGLSIVHPSDWDYVVSVTPTEDGAVYSVSGSDGRELASGLSEAELADEYPDLYAKAHTAARGDSASVDSADLPLAIVPF